MQPAKFIDIDCDLYASTKEALDWAFKAKIAQPGTLIGYDDWWTLSCDAEHLFATSDPVGHPLLSGEGRAHLEITRAYGVRFRCITG